MASVAGHVVARADDFIAACQSDWRTDPVETITGELLPLCAALRWIGKRGPAVLRPKRHGLWGRPIWLAGVQSAVHRVPLGTVLILGTWNYPVLLPGVQIAQAIAAGNRVLFKPAVGTERAAEILVGCFREVGISEQQLVLTDSSVEAASEAIDSGVDLVVLTGSAGTGRKVLASVAPTIAAAIMELSGCDAVLACDGCDSKRVAKAIRFGLTFNGGATCIGPRRLLVKSGQRDTVISDLLAELQDEPEYIVHPVARDQVAEQISSAIADGAVDLLGRFDKSKLRASGRLSPIVLDRVHIDDPIANADLFAPVISVIECRDVDLMIAAVNQCPYRLAASVFADTATAKNVAERLEVGSVTINDLIAPTADPRLPFGGRGQSGFGVTRGAEGLLAMTAAKVVSTRKGNLLPHLDRRRRRDRDLLQGLMEFLHGGRLQSRLSGLKRMVRGVKTEDEPRGGDRT
ncbi:aldehyde dehydrogenase family protein [Stieleria sp. JC731]|nr:aldehyde dehydrogenase family protein [Stieleria sp. JC731]